jgi:hypothetical protein
MIQLEPLSHVLFDDVCHGALKVLQQTISFIAFLHCPTNLDRGVWDPEPELQKRFGKQWRSQNFKLGYSRFYITKKMNP